MPESKDLPFDVVKEQLDTLAIAVGNLLDREWPEKWDVVTDGGLVVAAHVRVANNTLRTIRYACADSPPDPARKLEFAASIPPMARTILDSLFTVVFLFDDFPAHMALYTRAGWREMQDEHARYQAEYASDPDWTEWLTGFGGFVAETAARYGVTPEEIANPKVVRFFPTPGQILKDRGSAAESVRFLTYMNDWFYRELSQSSHLSLPGLLRRARGLFERNPSPEDDEVMEKYKSDCIVTALILFVALLSEVQVRVGFNLSDRCRYLWTALAQFGPAQEVYKRRYEAML